MHIGSSQRNSQCAFYQENEVSHDHLGFSIQLIDNRLYSVVSLYTQRSQKIQMQTAHVIFVNFYVICDIKRAWIAKQVISVYFTFPIIVKIRFNKNIFATNKRKADKESLQSYVLVQNIHIHAN